ncbi:RagB/SusD family nutrient uptake outer membrane protein [Spirosoma areae]
MTTIKFRSLGLPLVALLLATASCTDLDDKVLDGISAESSDGKPVPIADPAAALRGVYTSLNGLTDQAGVYAMEEHPSDEMMGPTRGTDWDDFGTWRKLHQHTWDPSHDQVSNAWDAMNSAVFRATQVVSAANATPQIKAEAQFLRAFFMHYVVDLYGQVPFREVTDGLEANPKVFTRVQATDFIIKDLEAAEAVLPYGAATAASKGAAQFLLAKMYLNKAVYTNDPTKPAGPFTFAKADMDKVIQYINAIQTAGRYSLQAKGTYFDNFHWENRTRSKELIFTINKPQGNDVGSVRNRYYMTLHYNTQPGGWNGFTTLADFYNSFDPKDERLGGPYPGLTDKTGLNAGFLVGQQVDAKGQPLKERGGTPLIFTKDININYATEAKGIRVIKYLPQPGNFDNIGTDYIFFRYADALLMKAEALVRGGTDPKGETAASIVNGLRTVRGVANKTPIDDKAILAERGYELYWEGVRRTDQIRFGTFNAPVDQRAQASPETRAVFPIPQRAVDSNPNLKQNPGY